MKGRRLVVIEKIRTKRPVKYRVPDKHWLDAYCVVTSPTLGSSPHGNTWIAVPLDAEPPSGMVLIDDCPTGYIGQYILVDRLEHNDDEESHT